MAIQTDIYMYLKAIAKIFCYKLCHKIMVTNFEMMVVYAGWHG